MKEKYNLTTSRLFYVNLFLYYTRPFQLITSTVLPVTRFVSPTEHRYIELFMKSANTGRSGGSNYGGGYGGSGGFGGSPGGFSSGGNMNNGFNSGAMSQSYGSDGTCLVWLLLTDLFLCLCYVVVC